MADLKCYFDYNEGCYRDIEDRNIVNYVSATDREIIIYPCYPCYMFKGEGPDEYYGRRTKEYNYYKDLGFNAIVLTMNSDELKAALMPESKWSSDEIIIGFNCDLTSLNDLLRFLFDAKSTKKQFRYYFDEPVGNPCYEKKVFLHEIYSIASIMGKHSEVFLSILKPMLSSNNLPNKAEVMMAMIKAFSFELMMSEWTKGGFAGIGADDRFERYAGIIDSLSYSGYSDDWDEDQTDKWKEMKVKYGEKAKMGWINIACTPRKRCDWTEWDTLLENSYRLFNSVGIYTCDIFSEIKLFIEGYYLKLHPDKRECIKIPDHHDWMVPPYWRWPPELYEVCKRDNGLEKLYEKCNDVIHNAGGLICPNDCELCDILCSMLHRRLEEIRKIMIQKGWLVQQYGTKRVYCCFGDCQKCRDKDPYDATYWCRNPLPICQRREILDPRIKIRTLDVFIRDAQGTNFIYSES